MTDEELTEETKNALNAWMRAWDHACKKLKGTDDE